MHSLLYTYYTASSSPGPFPAFQCCIYDEISACDIEEKLRMGGPGDEAKYMYMHQASISLLAHTLTHTHTYHVHTLTRSQTMSENSDMQREIPRLHAVLASKSKRIGELEHMLRETKDAANQEYDRLRAENERLRDSFTAKLKEKERECEGINFSSEPELKVCGYIHLKSKTNLHTRIW